MCEYFQKAIAVGVDGEKAQYRRKLVKTLENAENPGCGFFKSQFNYSYPKKKLSAIYNRLKKLQNNSTIEEEKVKQMLIDFNNCVLIFEERGALLTRSQHQEIKVRINKIQTASILNHSRFKNLFNQEDFDRPGFNLC